MQQLEVILEVGKEGSEVASRGALEGHVELDEIEVIIRIVGTTSVSGASLPSRIGQLLLYHLHLALAVGAALVVA